MNEPLTLYKLIILYMLNKVPFPLTKAQIEDFILGKQYTNYLTLQTAFSEILDAGMISKKQTSNRTLLSITDVGLETLGFFQNRISDAIKDDITSFLVENEYALRDEVSVRGEYYKSTSGEYEAELTAYERDVCLISLKLSVPTEEIATSICDNWQAKNQDIYKYLIEKLF